MVNQTFKINKMPTFDELKQLNWIQVVYPKVGVYDKYHNYIYTKICDRYKVLNNDTCKNMRLYYWNFAGFDHKMLLSKASLDRHWVNCSVGELFHQFEELHNYKGAYAEANGNYNEFASRLSGKRTKKQTKK